MFEMFEAKIAPTPKDTVFREGKGSLYRFRGTKPDGAHVPVLLVPSMINRWYVMDLREGASVATAVSKGAPYDTFLFDWGIPEDEDRYLTWDECVKKLHHVVNKVLALTGQTQLIIFGYCMGATLSSTYAALHPERMAGFINLAGPIDFTHAGRLGLMVDKRWFDPEAMTAAGNLGSAQMQSGFTALAPTGSVSKWIGLADKIHDERARDAFAALDKWAGDNIPFPGAAYVTYIKELYQENRLFKGEFRVGGEPVNIAKLTCPVMTIVADRDAICPPPAATAFNDLASSDVKDVLSVPGGHVGAVVGSRAAKELYPRVRAWLEKYGALSS